VVIIRNQPAGNPSGVQAIIIDHKQGPEAIGIETIEGREPIRIGPDGAGSGKLSIDMEIHRVIAGR